MTSASVEAAALDLSRSPSMVGKLLRHAHEIPDAPALRYRGTETSWREYADSALRLAADLRSRGVGRGDRVAVLTTNRPEFILVTAATAALGAIIVPINFRLTAAEVAYIVDNTTPALLVTEPDTLDLVHGALGESTAQPVVIDCASEEFLRATGEGDPLAVDEIVVPAGSDDYVILHTSGTTGHPKGAVLTCHTV